MGDWPLDAISRTLGVSLLRVSEGLYTAKVENDGLGIKLKLEFRPQSGAVRAFIERSKRVRPSFIARIEIRGVTEIVADPSLGEVIVRGGAAEGALLSVSANGTIRHIAGSTTTHEGGP